MTSKTKETVSTNSYGGLLKHLKPGDIIVTSAAPAAKGNKVIETAQKAYSGVSRVIQGDFTHAALYTGGGKAIDIRVGQPASERAVSDILHRLDARVVRPSVDHSQRREAVQYARGLVQAGATYDANPLHFAKVLASDLVHVKARPPEEASKNLICSNLVSRAYGRTVFSPKKDNDLLMPKDFLNSPATRPIAHFRNPGRHDVTQRAELKVAAVDTTLLPHQQRVVERMRNQPGLVVAHGLGSGKTLTSIATAEDQGGDVGVVVPAALRSNYEKELGKHISGKRDANYDISSLQGVARGHVPSGKKLLIVDEAHRARDAGSKTTQGLRAADAEKRMLLTGSAMYNRPADLAGLVNLAAGSSVFPSDRGSFERKYIGEKTVSPGLLARLRGISMGSRPVLQNQEELKSKLDQWVDYHENDTTGFPAREDVNVETPMSERQRELYRGVMSDAPTWLAYKVRKGLPPNKQEVAQLNAFANAARQISLSPGGFVEGMSAEEAAASSPKIQKAVGALQESIKANPNHRAVVYSNYLDSGVTPYEAELKKRGIRYGKFTGAVKSEDRDRMVKDYNSGKIQALLLSSAGGEGLDLKGTRQIQVLEPHWNKEKVQQVIGRGIRFGSHGHLPEDQRNVRVEHYRTVQDEPGRLAKLFGKKRDGSIDEYMTSLGNDKDALNEQVRTLLRSRNA